VTYFPDLTPHTYVEPVTDHVLLNVGWLDAVHPYARGNTPPEFQARLGELCQRPIHLHRGIHSCELCPLESVGGGSPRAGNGQVRVEAADGRRYAAPTLVWHYVQEHNYCPPVEFISAVLLGSVLGEES